MIEKLNNKIKEINVNFQIKYNWAFNLEKGIFNNCLEEASRKKLVKKWDNPYFVLIYLNKLKTINPKKKLNIILELYLWKIVFPYPAEEINKIDDSKINIIVSRIII